MELQPLQLFIVGLRSVQIWPLSEVCSVHRIDVKPVPYERAERLGKIVFDHIRFLYGLYDTSYHDSQTLSLQRFDFRRCHLLLSFMIKCFSSTS